MQDLLCEVRAEVSPTVLLVTHDLDEAGLADRVVVLVDGRVRQQAEPDVLHRRPADLAVARLVGGFTELPGTVRGGTHHSAWGALPVDPAAGLSDGAATLLLRREALTLGEVTRGSRGPGATGVVEALRHRGVRRLARVACGDGASSVLAEVELPAGHPVALGDRVRVTAPAEPAWAVADGQP